MPSLWTRFKNWWYSEDSGVKRVPHIWSLWEVADRPATGEHGQKIGGVKSMQVRRCARCGMTEERPVAPGMWEFLPGCERDEDVNRFSGGDLQ